jgi:hypothetical protein
MFDALDTELRLFEIHVDRTGTSDRAVDGVTFVCAPLRDGPGGDWGTACSWNNGRTGGGVYGVRVDQGSVIETASEAEKVIEGRAVVAHHRIISDPQPAHAVVVPGKLGGLPLLDDPRLKAQSDAITKDAKGMMYAVYGVSVDAPTHYVLLASPTSGTPGVGDRGKAFDNIDPFLGVDAIMGSLGLHVDRATTSARTVEGVTYVCVPLRDGSGGQSGALCKWDSGRLGGALFGVGVDQEAVIGTATEAEKLIEGPAVAAPH